MDQESQDALQTLGTHLRASRDWTDDEVSPFSLERVT